MKVEIKHMEYVLILIVITFICQFYVLKENFKNNIKQ